MRIILLLLLFCNSTLACEVMDGGWNAVLIPATEGAPIKSPISGVVTGVSAFEPEKLGEYEYDTEGDAKYVRNSITIMLRDGTYATFIKLKSATHLKKKDLVNIGDVIGYVGTSTYDRSGSEKPMAVYIRSESGIYDLTFPPPQGEIEYLLNTLDESCTPDEEKEE